MGLVRASMKGNGATTSANLVLHWSGVRKMYQFTSQRISGFAIDLIRAALFMLTLP